MEERGRSWGKLQTEKGIDRFERMGVGIRWGGEERELGGRRDAGKEGEEEEEKGRDGGMNTERERLVEGETEGGTER